MRNRYKLTALIIVTILLQSTIQAYAQRNGASLRGGEVDKTMKLYWETYDWPQTLTGFNIKKQSGEGSSWNKLNAEVIYPQIDERNWQNQGLNEEQGKESLPTFFLHRNLEKPYHIDYVFGSKCFSSNLKNVEIGNIEKWLEISDHLPVICEFLE